MDITPNPDNAEIADTQLHYQRIVALCAAIQSEAGRPLSKDQARRVMRDLTKLGTAEQVGADTPTHFDTISVTALTSRLVDQITLESRPDHPHLSHEELTALLAHDLEAEWQLAMAKQEIEADTLT